MKVTGVEIVKSSIPKIIRGGLSELMQMILNSTDPYSNESKKEFNDFIEKQKQIYKSLVPESIAFPRGITELNKWISGKQPIKGTPIHVFGAIKYNNYIRENKLEGYEMISEGSKIKFIYLKTPNKFNSHVISFQEKLPEEFISLIDYKIMIEKTFFDIISLILDEIKLSLDYKNNSNSLMGFLKKK
jgi:DNA polymerase elongation subunit (family B)